MKTALDTSASLKCVNFTDSENNCLRLVVDESKAKQSKAKQRLLFTK